MKTLVPVYYQIKQTIKDWILNKEFTTGQKIPSTNKLAKQFKVNHLTVRQAIDQLIQEGFLTSKRGSGTFVSDNEALISSLSIEVTGFMDEIFYQVQKAKTKSVVIHQIPATTSVREKLELTQTEETVLQIKRIRYLNDSAFNYVINYLPMKIGSKIIEAELFKKPLLQILEQDLNIQFTEAYQTIHASFADQEVSGKLKVPSGSPILFVERIMYTKNHKPVQLLNASYRGDLFKYIVRLKNVRSKNKSLWIHQDR